MIPDTVEQKKIVPVRLGLQIGTISAFSTWKSQFRTLQSGGDRSSGPGIMQCTILPIVLQFKDRHSKSIGSVDSIGCGFSTEGVSKNKEAQKVFPAKCQADMRLDVMGSPQNRAACLNHDDVTPFPAIAKNPGYMPMDRTS
jgi:hypothetical protein